MNSRTDVDDDPLGPEETLRWGAANPQSAPVPGSFGDSLLLPALVDSTPAPTAQLIAPLDSPLTLQNTLPVKGS
jgi:hypothetical protein